MGFRGAFLYSLSLLIHVQAFSATFVVSSLNDSGTGSLRSAIAAANDASGPDTITFSVSGTIQPLSLLPSLHDSTGGTTIDGGGQIVLDGIAMPDLPNDEEYGLTLNSANNVIKNLTIIRFAGRGIIVLNGGLAGNTIRGCRIGTDGLTAYPNYLGIEVRDGAIVGGTSTADRNIISGNLEYGLRVRGSDNVIQGNYIGVDATGAGALGNGSFGMTLEDAWTGGACDNNVIGGTDTGAGNVISGNGMEGVLLRGDGAVVQGNRIGTNAAGTEALGNGSSGILFILPTTNSLIGGTAASARNIISGNAGVGIQIYADPEGGVYSEGNMIQGNYIGTDITGTAALGNTVGIMIHHGARNNLVGGTEPGAGNVISGNTFSGMELQQGANNILVQGNLIGTDAAGAAPLGNGVVGIFLSLGAFENIIGGSEPGAGNVLSANLQGGVALRDEGVTQNVLQGNWIGTNAAGAPGLGNLSDGIVLYEGASGNTIGGMDPGSGNVIAYNGTGGFHSGVSMYDVATTDNAVLGNSIHSNSGSGIEYFNSAPNPSPPQLTALGPIQGTAPAGARVELFLDSAEEGKTFLDAVTASGDGTFVSQVSLAGVVNKNLKATATAAGQNTSRFSAYIALTDEDDDGMADWWEQEFGLNIAADDAGDDKDGDGFTNLEEFDAGMDPSVANVLTFQIGSLIAGASETLALPIHLSGASTQPGTLALRVLYDPGVLTLTGVSTGSAISDAAGKSLQWQSAPGDLLLSAAGGTAPMGDGVFATLNFQVVATAVDGAVASLTGAVVEAISVSVHPIQSGVSIGTVTVKNGTWVSFAYQGQELGTYSKPFNTFTEGVSAVATGGTLRILNGTSSFTGRLGKGMRLLAESGTVRLGIRQK